MKNLWWLFDLLMFVMINNCSFWLPLKYININFIYHGLNTWLVTKIKAWVTSELRKGLETQTCPTNVGKHKEMTIDIHKWIPLLEFKFCKCFEYLKQKCKKKTLSKLSSLYIGKGLEALILKMKLHFHFPFNVQIMAKKMIMNQILIWLSTIKTYGTTTKWCIIGKCNKTLKISY
jgi:hypothetical protein